AIGGAAIFAFARYAVPLDFAMIGVRLWSALTASINPGANARMAVTALIDPNFAFSLAWAICAVALGLLTAVFVMHVVWIPASLLTLGRIFKRSRNMQEFAAAYEKGAYVRLSTHPLIGHAWKEFDETLVKPEPG